MKTSSASSRKKIVRITTIPLSLDKLLEGQLGYMNDYFEVIAVSSQEGELKQYAQKEGVRYYHLDLTRSITPFKDFVAILKLFFFLLRERPTIVHTHTPKAGLVGMIASFFARVPHRIHTVAGLPLMEAQGRLYTLLWWVEKLIYKCAHQVWPNSKGLEDYIVKVKLAGRDQLKVLGKGSSNGIDIEHFSPKALAPFDREQWLKDLGIPSDHFIWVFVGRLVGDKGINELVEAFLEYHRQYQKSTLLLVGPEESELDPLKQETLNQIQQHPNIVCTGYQNDVRPYFALSDVLVFPSYREGFPNVVLQAAAMEVPAIVSDINGCNEIVVDKKTGWIVPVKSAQALYYKMIDVRTSSDNLKEIGIEARKRVEKDYARSVMREHILHEYQSCLSK